MPGLMKMTEWMKTNDVECYGHGIITWNELSYLNVLKCEIRYESYGGYVYFSLTALGHYMVFLYIFKKKSNFVFHGITVSN